MKSETEWKRELTPEQYKVLREKDTEVPFTGQLLHNEEKGGYYCAACGAQVFSSEHKFDSHSGWPSFYTVANNKAVVLKEDNAHGMQRLEVTCANCGSHLGHVFHDAPDQPSGMRFCINSVALDFKKDKAK